MPLIEWDESYSVNNAEIDGQHRRWLEIINDLAARLEGGGGEAAADQGQALAAMMEYARRHFIFEEKYMREIGFPATVAHIKSHNECYARISSFLLTSESGGSIQTGELLRFLRRWLLEHILHEDKQYSHHAALGR